MELTGDQLKVAEFEVKKYLPLSLQVYGFLVLESRFKINDHTVFVDQWPEFRVIVCRPHYEGRYDFFKATLLFAKDENVLREIMSNSSINNWTNYFAIETSFHHMEIVKEIASEKGVPTTQLVVCCMMTLDDASKLPSIDSSGISLGTVNDTHAGLINRTWRFSDGDHSLKMISYVIKNFPSCCVLDAEGNPLSWLLTYSTCAMGLLYTRPEYRQRGYAKLLISTMSKRFLAEGFPVYCYIAEENRLSQKLFTTMGFTEVLSHRECWYGFNKE